MLKHTKTLDCVTGRMPLAASAMH